MLYPPSGGRPRAGVVLCAVSTVPLCISLRPYLVYGPYTAVGSRRSNRFFLAVSLARETYGRVLAAT
jgi:hypothetical protein